MNKSLFLLCFMVALLLVSCVRDDVQSTGSDEPREQLSLPEEISVTEELSDPVPDGYVYAYGSEDLLVFLSDELNKNKTLVLKNDIFLDGEITVTFPFTLITDGNKLSADRIVFVSGEYGKMIIQNEEDEINCDIVCDTPEWEYVITSLFSYFEEEVYCRVNAKSVNGKDIDTSCVFVGSAGDWIFHFEEKDERFSSVTLGDFTVPEYTFTYPLTLNASENTGFENGISFVTEEKGTIVINAPRDAIKTIYAPNCDVIITGDAPSYDYAEKYFAFASYNGIYRPGNLVFGGTPPQSITLDGIEGVIEGNYVYFSYPFLQSFDISSYSLSSTGDGIIKAETVEENSSYYAVFTDVNSEKRGYKIIAERQNNSLPVIYIEIEDGKTVVSKEEYLNCTVTVDYNSYEGSEEFDEIISLPAGIRGRGHSSWELDKKPYKLKFETKASLFGLTKAKKWVLQANHTDRTLFRNTLAMRMGEILDNMLFIPHSYPVDLFVNGEYVGVYTLTEQIEIHKGRIEGEENSTETDTDYLIEMGEDGTKTSFGYNVFHSSLELFMAIKNPDEDTLTQAQYDFVKDCFNKADEAVKSGKGYEEYIDIDSLIDWFILDEFSYNLDCTFRRSGIYLKKKNDKIYLASPWDFDCAFGNFSLDDYSYTGWISLGNSKTDSYDEYIKTNWMDYLLKDDAFKAKLRARWDEVGEELYQAAINTINTLSETVGASASYNFTVWDKVFGNKLQYESVKSRTLMTYEEQIDYLKWFIETRYEWINSEISKY